MSTLSSMFLESESAVLYLLSTPRDWSLHDEGREQTQGRGSFHASMPLCTIPTHSPQDLPSSSEAHSGSGESLLGNIPGEGEGMGVVHMYSLVSCHVGDTFQALPSISITTSLSVFTKVRCIAYFTPGLWCVCVCVVANLLLLEAQ
jgi:hypothetical protein